MPDVIKSSRPNIVLFLTDQLRADSCGCFGQNPNITPALDSLAAAGVKFNHAIAAHGTSTAARGILQTGKLATDTGLFTLNGTLPQGVKTLAQYLSEAGYQTGYVGQWQLADDKATRDAEGEINGATPVELSERGGFNGFWRAANNLPDSSDHEHGYLFDENGTKLEFNQGRSTALVDYAKEFLQGVGAQPFFLTVAPFDPMPQQLSQPITYLRQIYQDYIERMKASEITSEEENRAALEEVQQHEREFDPKLAAQAQAEAAEQAQKEREEAEAAFKNAAESEKAAKDAEEEGVNAVKELTVNENETNHWCYLCDPEVVANLPLRINLPLNTQLFRPGLIFEYYYYLGQCRVLDQALGALVEHLKAQGLYDNTVIIFATMTGTALNSRNNDLNCMTEEALKLRTGTCHYDTVNVPLVVGGGAVKTCRPVDDVVSNASLTRTILSLAGAQIPDDIVGENLLDLAHDLCAPEAQGPQGKPAVTPNEMALPPHEGTITPGRVQQALVQISENRLGRALVTDEFTYAIFAPEVDGSTTLSADHYKDDFLYEAFSDPYQIYNKSVDELYTDIKLQLREQLLDLIERTEHIRPSVANAERYYAPLDEDEESSAETEESRAEADSNAAQA